MKIWILGICLMWGCISAASSTTLAVLTTTKPPLSTPYSSSNTPLSTVVSGSTPGSTEKPNTEKPTHNELLRRELSISPLTHRLRGRVVLATTRVEGSDDWGVSADQAEVACDRIARYQSESTPPTFLLHTLLRRFIPVHASSRSQPMEGHLLSVGSGYEVMALSRLLNPLPKGSYWTGGRLTRYRVNSMRNPTHTDHIVLTWTDGRSGRPSVLGMTKLDEQQLREGYTYCLALNLREAAWQARDCSDQLPYACLITPRQISFSNQASSAKTTEAIMTTTQEPSTEWEGNASTETSEAVIGTTSGMLPDERFTQPSDSPVITEIANTVTADVLPRTNEALQENLLADLMRTPSQVQSTDDNDAETLSEESSAITKNSLLEDIVTATPDVARTTIKAELEDASRLTTSMQSSPPPSGSLSMTTAKLLNDKMTTMKYTTSTTGKTKSELLQSVNVSPSMPTHILSTATPRLLVAPENTANREFSTTVPRQENNDDGESR